MNKFIQKFNLLDINLGQEQNWIKVFIFFSVVFHLLAAYYNVGFLHPDEHYQIIEFASYKLGNIDSSFLAWEYGAELRPSIQPILCMFLLNFFELFTDDPFNKAILLRLFASITSLLSVWLLVKNIPERFDTKWSKLIIVFFSFAIWYEPFVHSRFSSETGSSIFMVLGLVYFFKFEETRKLLFVILAGLFWGLSFEFRFQAGIMIFFYGLWILIYRTKDFKIHLLQIASFLLVILLALGLDYYFYGKLVFPPYNYFVANIVDDVASSFGVSPWDHYFLIMKRRSFEPISIINIFTLLYLLFFQRKHIITWLIIPFIVFHSIIPHKETRFLFPILYLSPYAMSLTLLAFRKKYLDPGFIRLSLESFRKIKSEDIITIKYKLSNIFIIIWFFMLPIALWKSVYPATFRSDILEYIYNNYDECTIINLREDGDKHHHLQQRFYFREGLKDVAIEKKNLSKEYSQLQKPVFIIHNANHTVFDHRFEFKKIMDSQPIFYEELIKKEKLQIENYQVLYEITPK